jgi:thiol-activated cytolysin
MKSPFLNAILVLILTIFLSNCKKDDLSVIDPNNLAIDTAFTNAVDSVNDEFLDSLVQLALNLPPQPTVIPTPNLLEEIKEADGDSMYCVTRTYEWAPGREESLLMNPSTDVISLGQLLKAESITDGSYTPIIAPRNPICISLSLTNINGSPKDSITDPSKYSSAQEGLQRLLSRELVGNGAAGHTKTIENIYSYQQSQIAVGANYSGGSYDVSASFDWTSTKIKSRYMVKFFQHYYSISVDMPAKPSDFFAEAPDPALLGSYSPVYVSSIKYGRVLMFMLESESSESEMNAEVEASFNGLVADGGLNAEAHLNRLMSKSSIKIFVIGGNAQDAVDINSLADVETFITQGGNFSNQSPGVPIAYTLRFLKDNSIAKVVQSSKYTVRECEVVPATPFEFQPSDKYEWPAQLINGDGEYGGDGFPHTTATVDLSVKNETEVWAHFNTLFEEKRDDYTTGLIDDNRLIFTVPAGYKIVSIVTPKHWDGFQADMDHDPNTFEFGNDQDPNNPIPSSLVSRWVVNGDTGGDDLPGDFVGADRSWAKIFLNKIVVTIRKIQ